MHPARHQVVPGPLRGRAGQDGRLYVDEASLVEVLQNRQCDLVPQSQIALQLAPSQVQESVSQSGLFGGIDIPFDCEGQWIRSGEDRGPIQDHLDLPGRHLRIDVLRRALLDNPLDIHHPFETHRVEALGDIRILVGSDDDLHDSRVVSEL